jgi:hypothetical protein
MVLKWILKIVVGFIALIILIAGLAFLFHPRGKAVLKSKKHFIVHEDARIRYEPGMASYAARVADMLDDAIKGIAEAQGRPFADPIRIYVCASQKSFNAFIGMPGSPALGCSFIGRIYLPPKIFQSDIDDFDKHVLVHELSHLHVYQHMGMWHVIRKVPGWFQEGLANSTSGYWPQGITREEVIQMIQAGRALSPDDTGHFPRPKQAGDYGLSWAAYHAQARLFTDFLRVKYPTAFQEFLQGLLSREKFADAFIGAYGKTVTELWRMFAEQFGKDT